MSDPTRPARDELPVLACFAERNGGQLVGARREAVAALDEIDTLRREVQRLGIELGYLEDIARCRGEENERLRAAADYGTETPNADRC